MIVIQMGEWSVTPEKFVIKKENSDEIQVKSLCMKILWCLIEHDGKVVSKDTLIKECWDGRIVSDDAVRQAIKELRDYLGCNGYESSYIETIRKQGYRLISTVEPVEEKSPQITTTQVIKKINAKSLFKSPWMLITLFCLAGAGLFNYLEESKSYTLAENPKTITYDKKRALDYEKSSLGWDTYTLLGSGIFFGEEIVVRDEKKKLIHLLKPSAKDGHLANSTFSPDGTKLAYLDYSPHACAINIINSKTKEIIKKIKCSKSDTLIAIDWFNNEEIYYSSSANESIPLSLRQYNLITNEQHNITTPAQGGRGDYYTRSCDGTSLILRNPDLSTTDILIYKPGLPKNSRIKLLKNIPEIVSSVDWVPNCKMIALYLNGKGINSLSLSDGTIKPINKHLDTIQTLRIHDQKMFVSMGELVNEEIVLFDINKMSGSTFISSGGRSTLLVKKTNSDDYAFISTKTGLPQLWINRNNQDVQLTRFESDTIIRTIDFSIDTDALYFAEGNNIYHVNLVNNKVTMLYTSKSIVKSLISVDENKLLFSSYTNKLWQGFSLDTMTNKASALNNISIKDFRKDNKNDVYFRGQDNGIYHYDISLNENRSLTIAPDNCTDWTINKTSFYCLADGKLLKKDTSTQSITTLLSQSNIGTRFYFDPGKGFYLEQSKPGIINIQEYKINNSYF